MKVGFKQHGSSSYGLRRGRHYRPGAFLAAAAFCALAAACGDRAEVYFKEARRYEADYEFEKAARRYELVAVGFKRSALEEEAAAGLARCRAEIHFDRAEELIFAGSTYTAVAEVVAGRRFDPDNPRGLYLTGLAHRYMGPRELALEEFNDCIKQYPESPYGYLGRAEYFRFGVEREEALADYVRAFRVGGRDARGRGGAFRGILDMTDKLGRPEKEVNRYRREAKGVIPAEAFNYWVGYYYLHKRPVLYRYAQEYFDKVIAAPGRGAYSARAYAARAECDSSRKDYERAKADIDRALALDAENDAFYKTAEAIYRKLSLPPPRKTQK